ncbi:hypothetical protein LNP27_06165 [Flavobacterium galactosidilyticum]|uniref:hypothetical protein n=1 Tax=Flavobacterium galactosidilyticum TaxID=2893886 RepID=UPI001E459432|nr:hypothetical protein [Flavobacterium sp. F-340]UFH47617.1 hypothetical protein LNP27_06165 [Flavobacterium sp. F-340]
MTDNFSMQRINGISRNQMRIFSLESIITPVNPIRFSYTYSFFELPVFCWISILIFSVVILAAEYLYLKGNSINTNRIAFVFSSHYEI